MPLRSWLMIGRFEHCFQKWLMLAVIDSRPRLILLTLQLNDVTRKSDSLWHTRPFLDLSSFCPTQARHVDWTNN
uniref:Putative ovule protein n=1 Tax=Solanum chacoense TaxID=4108 RepID=A0A0V0GHQ0_SOLCH